MPKRIVRIRWENADIVRVVYDSRGYLPVNTPLDDEALRMLVVSGCVISR